jgi:hypothetical protein
MTDLSHSTAAERNKQPILDLLGKVLGARGAALEIASGTGQHAAWFAAALAEWTWQPTDADARTCCPRWPHGSRTPACPTCCRRCCST